MDLAIDDFGTGYSSLSYLKTLPVDSRALKELGCDEYQGFHSSPAMTPAQFEAWCAERNKP